MRETTLDVYASAFIARQRHELSLPDVLVSPGVRGVALIRLLVTDDRGFDRLAAELTSPWRGAILVLESAPRCNELVRTRGDWGTGHSELAMVLPDVQLATGPALPMGLHLRSPCTEPDSAAALDEIARLMIDSDPSVKESGEQVAAMIRRLPSSARVLAAFDETGAARATAACHVFEDYAEIFFVATHPAWRRRGIGQAMTVAAVRAAAELGARSAFLHATEDGVSVYERIGFQPIGMLTWYQRPA